MKTTLSIIVLLIFTATSFAAVGVKKDNAYVGEATHINVIGADGSFDGTTATFDVTALDITSLETSGAIEAGTTVTAGTNLVGAGLSITGGIIELSQSGENITLLGKPLTVSGTDLYWAGSKLTN
jgi:hypothetical protein